MYFLKLVSLALLKGTNSLLRKKNFTIKISDKAWYIVKIYWIKWRHGKQFDRQESQRCCTEFCDCWPWHNSNYSLMGYIHDNDPCWCSWEALLGAQNFWKRTSKRRECIIGSVWHWGLWIIQKKSNTICRTLELWFSGEVILFACSDHRDTSFVPSSPSGLASFFSIQLVHAMKPSTGKVNQFKFPIFYR